MNPETKTLLAKAKELVGLTNELLGKIPELEHPKLSEKWMLFVENASDGKFFITTADGCRNCLWEERTIFDTLEEAREISNKYRGANPRTVCKPFSMLGDQENIMVFFSKKTCIITRGPYVHGLITESRGKFSGFYKQRDVMLPVDNKFVRTKSLSDALYCTLVEIGHKS